MGWQITLNAHLSFILDANAAIIESNRSDMTI